MPLDTRLPLGPRRRKPHPNDVYQGPRWARTLQTPRRLLVAFTHGLPPLLQRAPFPLSPPRPVPQSTRKAQNKSWSQGTDTKRNLSHKAGSEVAPTSYSSVCRSVDTVSTPHSNSTVPEGSSSTPLSVSFDDLQSPDLDKPFQHSFLETGGHSSCSPPIHSSAARTFSHRQLCHMFSYMRS